MGKLSTGQWTFLRDSALILSFGAFALGAVLFAARSDPSSHGEWLVHYGDGFVRRGLPGEITLSLSEFTGIHPSIFVLTLQLGIYASLLIVLRRTFLASPTLSSALLLFAPGSLMYVFAEPSMAGRKDIVLFLAAALTLERAKDPKSSFSKSILVGALWAFAFLSHEAAFAFFPGIFLATILVGYGTGKRATAIRNASPSLFSFALSFVLIALSAMSTKTYELCDRVNNFTFDPRICDGAIGYVNQNAADLTGMIDSAILRSDSLFYVAFFGLASLLIVYSALANQVRRIDLITTLGLFLVGLVLISLIASDWGRWLHMFTVVGILAMHRLAKMEKPISKLGVGALLIAFTTIGFSFNGGSWMSPLGNLINLSYFLNGGMYG